MHLFGPRFLPDFLNCREKHNNILNSGVFLQERVGPNQRIPVTTEFSLFSPRRWVEWSVSDSSFLHFSFAENICKQGEYSSAADKLTRNWELRISPPLFSPEKMCGVLPQGCPRSHRSSLSYRSSVNPAKTSGAPCCSWKPLLLIVPLRLGINHINPVYVEAFKVDLPGRRFGWL